MLDNQTGAWVEWHPMRTKRFKPFFFFSESLPIRAGHAVGVVRREQLGGGGGQAPGPTNVKVAQISDEKSLLLVLSQLSLPQGWEVQEDSPSHNLHHLTLSKE